MRRCPCAVRSCALLSVLAITCGAVAAETASEFRIPPREPAESLSTFRLLHGFQLQLVAAEPLVCDPVDVAYDEDGRAYVIEMRDYPYPEAPNAKPDKPLGRVRLMIDKEGDGKFDTSSIFADELAWPTSVACWKGGVFVAAAPDLWYLKDVDGDGRAEEKRQVFTGFSRYNVQAIMNNLRWGLDHRIYGAASGNGGQVQRVTEPFPQAISLSGHDFAFDPVTAKFWAVSGGARFGNSFDDWGQRFVCNIRNPVQHVVFDARYLARNPFVAAPAVVHDVAESGDQLPVFRISPPEAWRMVRAKQWVAERILYPRSELFGAGFWTSSSGVTVYRGDAYPAEFQGNVFVGEVAGNLVHRQKIEPQGATFVSRRADPDAEFVSSTDNWFRPVNFVNAPDGTLHILDMYRETIEHPWSIPDAIKAKLDLLSGNDRGRIYRLCPPDFQLRKMSPLGTSTTSELVELLGHANAWHRETAQRLLFERQDTQAATDLRRLQRRDARPLARLHALYSLAGLQLLEDTDLLQALADPHPQVRRHAVILAGERIESSPRFRDKVVELAHDEELVVRFQVAFALGSAQGKAVEEALASIAMRDAKDVWVRTAVLTSRLENTAGITLRLLQSTQVADQPEGIELLHDLSAVVGSRGDETETRAVAGAALGLGDEAQTLARVYAVLGGLQKGLHRNRKKLLSVVGEETPLGDRLRRTLSGVDQVAQDGSAPVTQRVQGINLLAERSWTEAKGVLLSSLGPRQPPAVQWASLRVARQFSDLDVAEQLITNWPKLTPTLRQEVVEVLLSRPPWMPILLTALEKGTIPSGQMTIPQRVRLTKAADTMVQQRSLALFGPSAVGDRQQVIAKYQPELVRPGDAARGKLIFKRECLTCHRLGMEGHDIGPNLLTVRHRAPDEMLLHILDPNREVAPNFLSYQLTLNDGRIVTGVIAAETSNGVTLVRAENVRETFLRQDIDELIGTGKSMMPEGLEQKIAPAEMRDLITYLQKFD